MLPFVQSFLFFRSDLGKAGFLHLDQTVSVLPMHKILYQCTKTARFSPGGFCVKRLGPPFKGTVAEGV